MLEELYQIQQARLDVGADDLDIREEIAEVEEKIKKLQDETIEENSEEDIKNIEEIIELSKKEIDAKDENMTAILDIEDLISLEHILSDYKKLKEEFKAVDRECSRLECKEVELEKTIDLMAEFFNKRSWREHQLKDDDCYCCKTEYGADDCKDCLKEHFINKAKEVKK